MVNAFGRLDLALVVSKHNEAGIGAGTSGKEDYQGFVPLGPIDLGAYIGPSINADLYKGWGPSLGVGVLAGDSGFIAAKVGLQYQGRYGIGAVVPIYPIYGILGTQEFLYSVPPEAVYVLVPAVALSLAYVYRDQLKSIYQKGKNKVSRALSKKKRSRTQETTFSEDSSHPNEKTFDSELQN